MQKRVEEIVCAGCNKEVPIEQCLKALHHSWHAACFRCNVCNGDFEDGRFVPHKGKPYHKQCYDELFADKCAGCGKALKVSPMGLEPVLSTKRSQTASFALP